MTAKPSLTGAEFVAGAASVAVPREPTQFCPACGGAGEYWDGPTEAPERRQCEACYGTGLLDAAPARQDQRAEAASATREDADALTPLGNQSTSAHHIGLTFAAFRDANIRRCLKWHPAGIESWSPSDWLIAVTGELGELASLIKMRNRERDGLPGNKFSPSKKQIADEIADVLTYLDLFAAAVGVDLGPAAVEKFNEVSERVGFPDRIGILAHPTPAPDVCHRLGCDPDGPAGCGYPSCMGPESAPDAGESGRDELVRRCRSMAVHLRVAESYTASKIVHVSIALDEAADRIEVDALKLAEKEKQIEQLSRDRRDGTIGYNRLDMELQAAESSHAEATKVIALAQNAMRAPLDNWKGELERKALEAARQFLADGK